MFRTSFKTVVLASSLLGKRGVRRRPRDGGGEPDGRWRAHVRQQEHHPERGEFEGPHDVGRGGQSGRDWSTRSKAAGPFTVFAPTNEAFAKLPDGTVSTLLKPENKAKLTSILTYHVLPGKMTTEDLMAKIKEGHGKAHVEDGRGLGSDCRGP